MLTCSHAAVAYSLTAPTANIEENEYTDHTYEDLAFDFQHTVEAFKKRIQFLDTQIAAQSETGVSKQQLDEVDVFCFASSPVLPLRLCPLLFNPIVV